MEQLYEQSWNATVTRDDEKRVRDVLFRKPGLRTESQNLEAAAGEALRRIAPLFALTESEVAAAPRPFADLPEAEGLALRSDEVKPNQDAVTYAYAQSYFGLPVWQAGLSLTLSPGEFALVHATSTQRAPFKVKEPTKARAREMLNLRPDDLAKLLGLADTDPNRYEKDKPGRGNEKDPREPRLRINENRLWIYRYEAEKRLHEHPKEEQEGMRHLHFELPLPPVEGVEEGEHRVAARVLFSYPQNGLDLNWMAFIDVITGSVLLLRALIDNAAGYVFARDPSTQNIAASPSQNQATLDGYRSSVMLPGIAIPVDPTVPRILSGPWVQLVDFELPTVAAPTSTGNFNYGSRTNNFAAVNAYYLNDQFFQLVQGMGFNLATYFNGTTFPIRVDHRGRYGSADGNEINAYCAGNATSTGIGNVAYMLADDTDTTNPLGMATDYRVVLHELGGHGILWDHVSWPNFGFAHSAGDSFGAILMDPDTAQTGAARFETFPFSFQSIGLGLRRHDRAVASGWGWGGSQDWGGYNSEQILATTHFRIYRSLGGDSGHGPRRHEAARTTCYLILRTVGGLTTGTNPGNPTAYANAMLAADALDWTSEGYAGGAYNKVIRWAFEKQGLYRAGGAPTTSEGAPPAQDVYIDDGRGGQYPFQPVHWNNGSVWNRTAADGGSTHQNPIMGATNYVYVQVSNRGTSPATGVRVRGFHCDPTAGLTWPDDFSAMTTAQLTAPDIPSGGSVVVGPFHWSPFALGHECLLMIADSAGDPSNADLFTGGADSIPEWRLVPHDNNIGQRNVSPVMAGGVVEMLRLRPFFIRNSFRKRAVARLEVRLPDALEKLGWRLNFASPGGDKFGLEPGERKQVRMEMIAGAPFDPEEARTWNDRQVVITALLDGAPVGGMTFEIDPDYHEETPSEKGDFLPEGTGSPDLEHILECLGGRVKGVKVRSINVDILLKDDC